MYNNKLVIQMTSGKFQRHCNYCKKYFNTFRIFTVFTDSCHFMC